MLSGFKTLIRISMPTHRQTIVSDNDENNDHHHHHQQDGNAARHQLWLCCKSTPDGRWLPTASPGNTRPLSGIPENCIYLIQHHILYSSKTSLNILEYIHSELENVKSFTRTNINKPYFTRINPSHP